MIRFRKAFLSSPTILALLGDLLPEAKKYPDPLPLPFPLSFFLMYFSL